MDMPDEKSLISMEIPFFQVPNEIFDMNIEIMVPERKREKGSNDIVTVKRPMKTYEKLIYIYLCRCGNNKKQAFPSYKTIAEKCGIGRNTAIEGVANLIKNGLLGKRARIKEGTSEDNSNQYFVFRPKEVLGSSPSVPPSPPSVPQGSPPGVPPSPPGVPKKELYKKNYIEKELYKNIIDYLNQKANKNYKHTTKKTQQLINARIAESFTLEDFYKVIDNKTAEWMGKVTPEGIPMENYLRPETLFGNKFEGYLNQKGGSSKNGGDNNSANNKQAKNAGENKSDQYDFTGL